MSILRPLALAACSLTLCSCGGSAEGTPAPGASPAPAAPVTVSAAASLTEAFTRCGQEMDPPPRYSFAGSDELAAQIERGLTPDVYAAANAKLPQELWDKGELEEPVDFVSNRLVAIVPKGSSAVTEIEDAAKDGVTVVVGDPEVPIGSYTRTVLDNLDGTEGRGRDFSRRVLDNVRSNEPDVKGVVGKVRGEAADVGFVYVTDAKPVADAVDVIEIPEATQPRVTYQIAVVRGAKNPEGARAFVDSAVAGACQEELRAQGFEPAGG